MKEVKNNRTKRLHVRLYEEEFNSLHKQFRATTEARISDYVRKTILAKPMISGYRNQSLQDIITALVELRKDLNGIANNYNQMVHKLHTLGTYPDIKAWVLSYELYKKTLLRSIDEIKVFIERTSEKWLQS